MTLYEIFSHSDRFHYRARLLSPATCLLILCATLTLLPPFLLAYFAGGFWRKESLYTEQPRIESSSKYILLINPKGTTDPDPFFASSYASLNSLFHDALLSGTASISPVDTNQDGVPDQLTCTLEIFFSTDTVAISSIDAWLVFQYELRARQRLTMETAALIHLVPPGPSTTLATNPTVTVRGTLTLEQRQPIQSSGSDTTYNSSFVDSQRLLSTSSLNFGSVLNEYFSRKFYTSFQAEQSNWQPGISPTGSNKLTVNIIVDIRPQSIRFIPGFWQEFKWGWIQYVCLLLPFVAGFNRLREFAFRNQLVRTLVELPSRCYKA